MKTEKPVASYRRLWEDGELSHRVDRAWRLMEECGLCAHECHVRRLEGEKGFCRAGRNVAVASYGPHFGEEPLLVGRYGSGTIFFYGCNLRCVYCQNWDVSHGEISSREEITTGELANIMLFLQEQGCHNINLVTPSHYLPHIISAVNTACGNSLSIPLVYNCGGYEALEALRLLDGIVDIYLPDVKYADPELGMKYSEAPSYPEVVKAALLEMYGQVGNVKLHGGTAYRGLIIRHLVLPGGIAGTKKLMEFIATKLSPDVYVNIMGQYRPCYRAQEYPPFNRPVTRYEVEEARRLAREAGIRTV